MKKLLIIAVCAALAVIAAGGLSFVYSHYEKRASNHDFEKQWADAPLQIRDNIVAENKDANDRNDLHLENRDLGIEEKEDKRLETELEKELREYTSLRKKRSAFSFHLGLSIGGIGYSVVGGPRNTVSDLYRIRFPNGAFQFGFRGGMEGMFYINRIHGLCIGIFYEQRRAVLKINYIPLTGIALAGLLPPDPLLLYYTPVNRYIPRSVVDLHYLNFPVMYRYHFMDELYIGVGFDIALPLQTETGFGIILFRSSTNLKKRLSPVDFSGRLAFGFIMNKVVIEIGVGAGILKLDRMAGDRRSIYLTA